MPRRIFIIAVLITLTGWLGQITGCATAGQDQNYKLLDEDRPMFDTRPDTNKPGEARTTPAASNVLATAPAAPEPTKAAMDSSNTNTDSNANNVEQPDTKTIAEVQDALAAAPAEQRSVRGLDRSNWSKVTVGTDLSASYMPAYYHEADAHTNVWCLVAFERVCFAAQTVALPIKMIITPPWIKIASQQHPDRDSTLASDQPCKMADGSCDVKSDEKETESVHTHETKVDADMQPAQTKLDEAPQTR